ncbi:hypothetical protein AgCh_022053 [Apium graveolens]
MCAFSVASTGNRCVLESYGSNAGNTEFQCKTSDVFAENVAQWIEDDHCVEACGVDRKTVGISSDSLSEPRIIASVCSTACYDNCPNIVDLYYNLALAEGAYLPNLCKARNAVPRREMSQLLAWAPLSGNAESYGSSAWTPAPTPIPVSPPINAESDESGAWAPVPTSVEPFRPIILAPTPSVVIPFIPIPISWPPAPAPAPASNN